MCASTATVASQDIRVTGECAYAAVRISGAVPANAMAGTMPAVRRAGLPGELAVTMLPIVACRLHPSAATTAELERACAAGLHRNKAAVFPAVSGALRT